MTGGFCFYGDLVITDPACLYRVYYSLTRTKWLSVIYYNNILHINTINDIVNAKSENEYNK